MEIQIRLLKQTFEMTSTLLLATGLIVLTYTTGSSQGRAYDLYAHMEPGHGPAVNAYLGRRVNLRPAVATDCKNNFGLESFFRDAGPKAHPYYTVADLNRDNISDFAIALYDDKRKSGSRFMVVIFNGKKAGGYAPAHTVTGLDLRQGGIWTNGFGTDQRKTSLTVGAFETDDCIWIEWKGRRYVRHDCSAAGD